MTDCKIVGICVCGSSNVQKLKRVPIRHKHYIDYKITYKCLDCGKETVCGGV